MEHLSIYSALDIREPAVISFYGAGGKTTLIRKLGDEMVAAGKKVLLTTTTKIFKPIGPAIICESDPVRSLKKLQNHFITGNMAVLGKSILPNGKIEGVDPEQIGFLRDQLQVSILVEADGAKGKPLKGYAPYEPALPPASDYIIPILGGDALGSILSSANTHRLEYFLETSGREEGERVTENILAAAFRHMLERGQARAPQAFSCLVINKAGLIAGPGSAALKIAGLLKESFKSSFAEKLLITEARDNWPVKISLNLKPPGPLAPVSCVILAAGKSARMGFDKLALRAGSKTILEKTLDNVIASGIKDIVIVTSPKRTGSIPASGYEPDRGTGIKTVNNARYEEGMSTSLKAGLEAISPAAQGVLFALGDQPHVPAAVYSKLCQKYMDNLGLVTAPLFKGKRGNPVLFDRRTWPALMKLAGDKGGRIVSDNLEWESIDYIEADTPAVLWDIDSADDYLVYLDSLKKEK